MFSRIKGTVLAAFVVFGCREAAAPASCDPPITGADSPVLEVKFTDNLRIRGCSRATLHSESGAILFGLQAALDRARVVKLQPMISGNVVPTDMLSWHLLALAPGTDTTAAIAALSSRPEVQYVYSHSSVLPPPPTKSQ
ncbi:MAG TPA: hypothetical protein VF962_04730 [Gemmatimonadaceae bacterium]